MRNSRMFNRIVNRLQRQKQQWRTTWPVQLIRTVCIAVLVYGVFMIVTVMADRSANEKTYEAMRRLYMGGSSELLAESGASEAAGGVGMDGGARGRADDDLDGHAGGEADSNANGAASGRIGDSGAGNIGEKFTELLKLSDDIVGWLRVPDTNIDYPVVQADDNTYYLHRNVLGQSNDGGSIFMDYRNTLDPLSKHTILYGHHMKDGSMFKHLTKFKDKTFTEEHRVFTFDTLTESTEWEIFAVYLTRTSFNYIITDFADDAEYEKFIGSLKKHSYWDLGVRPTADDHILTLSTCDYAVPDGRFVVQARKISPVRDDT